MDFWVSESVGLGIVVSFVYRKDMKGAVWGQQNGTLVLAAMQVIDQTMPTWAKCGPNLAHVGPS